MKRLLSLALILLLIMSISICISASGSKIIDKAGLLSSRDISSLEDKAQKIADTYQMDVVIVTVDSLGGKTAQAFADDYFDYNGFGLGDKDSGILLLIAMNDREWAVSTHATARQVITNSDIDIIMEQVIPHLSTGDYGYAFDEFLTLVEIEYEAGITRNLPLQIAISLGVGALVALIVLLVMRSRMNTARAQRGAASYIKPGSYDLYRCQDFYLYSRTTRVRKQDNNGSGGHRSSSGRTHGGRSGRF